MPLVAFEGIDGSGKSTALAAVAASLRAARVDALATREETAGPTGEAVKRSIREGWDPISTAFLFAADRAVHVAQMRPWLQAGRAVLCDRFVHSTYAYQSVTLQGRVEDPPGFLRRLHEGWCPEPDRVVLFVCEPAKAVARTLKRGETTPYEKVGFLAKVQEAYLGMASKEPGRFSVLDAEGPADVVAKAALAAVRLAL